MMEDKNIDKNLNIEDMGEDNNHERDRKVAVNIVGGSLSLIIR